MKKLDACCASRSGFTLIELGIVVAIISIMLGGILSVANQKIRLAKQQELQIKLDSIENALKTFRKANGYLPCPGDLTEQTDGTDFGRQAAVPGTCTGGSPTANFDDSAETVAGSVPVRDINLPDSYAFDPWGGYIMYAVDIRATSASTFTINKLSDTSDIGSMTVLDAEGGNRTTVAIAVLVSFGPNGHGAYQVGGSRKFVGSTNAEEQENCDCDATSADTFDITFVQQPVVMASGDQLDSFDDVVRYYTRGSFLSSLDDSLTDKP